MTDQFNLIPIQPSVLLVGINNKTTGDAIFSTSKVLVGKYTVKMLESSPTNWQSIISCIRNTNTKCTIVKLSSRAYAHIASEKYAAVVNELFAQLRKVPHAIFVHEELLGEKSADTDDSNADHDAKNGNGEDDYLGDGYYYIIPDPPAAHVLEHVNRLMSESKLNVVSYATNAELNVLASAFITESYEGLIFRVYIPNGQLWANEAERLLQLFREYVANVARIAIRLDEQRTDRGTVYEFYSRPADESSSKISEIELTDQFQEFTNFLSLAVSNPIEAELLLKSKNVDVKSVTQILTRFAKEARRMLVDMRHDREQKILGIKQRLESELLDVLPNEVSLESMASLVEAAMPDFDGLQDAIKASPKLLQPNGSGTALTINVNQQIVSAVNAIVAEEVLGDVCFSAEERQLLDLIARYGGDQAATLETAAKELADTSSNKSGRLLALTRVKAFIRQMAPMVGDIGVELFKAYAKKELGLV